MATTIASIDTQHGDMVHDAQFDYYGRRLATCSSDRLIKVYDVSGDEHVQSAELTGCVSRPHGDTEATRVWAISTQRSRVSTDAHVLVPAT